MKKSYLVVVLLLVLSVGELSAQQFGTFYMQMKSMFEELPNDKGEIIFLGNSITQGAHWGELIGSKKVKSRGISGDTTDGVLYRLGEVVESKPKKIFLLIGTNDLARGKSGEYVLNNILKIADKIAEESPKTEIYVQSILPVNDKFGKFKGHTKNGDSIVWINSELKRGAEKGGYVFIDLYNSFVNEDGKMREELTNDGLHLLGSAYVEWISILKPYL